MGFIITLFSCILLLFIRSSDNIKSKRYDESIKKRIDSDMSLRKSLIYPERQRAIKEYLLNGVTDEKICKEIEKRLSIIFLNIPELSGFEQQWKININIVNTLFCISEGFLPSECIVSFKVIKYIKYPGQSIGDVMDYDGVSYREHVIQWAKMQLKSYGYDVEFEQSSSSSNYYVRCSNYENY